MESDAAYHRINLRSVEGSAALEMAGNATSEDLDGFLREAVSLNCARILCRQRSRHAKYKCNHTIAKKSQPRRLPLVLRAFKDSAVACGVSSSDFAKLVTDAEILNRLFTELESLTNIVVTCKQLQPRQGLIVYI